MKMKALVVAAGLVAAISIAVPSAGARATRSQAGVSWHGQMKSTLPEAEQKEGPVEGAWATLVRNANGISYSFHATQLKPGHAYTLWQVVANNPSACVGSCTPPQFFQNEDVDAQVSYAAGHVVGESGRATFSGSQRVGPIPEGWLPERGLIKPMTAEVHLVLNDHGPALSEYMPGMIRTYRGGCSDASPFPSIFPQKALDDGDPGDTNICRLTQMAAFRL